MCTSAVGGRQEWWRHDLVGGLTAGAVVIPQALAYATVAGLPVEVGLYTCMVPAVVYALLGGSRTLAVSTTSTVSVLSGSALLAAGVAATSPNPYRALATLTLSVGLMLLLAGLFGLAGAIDNISEATLTGIKTGTGVTIAVGQVPTLLGIPGAPPGSHVPTQLVDLAGRVTDASPVTLVVGGGTLLVLLLGRLTPTIPAPLVAVAAGIALSAVLALGRHGVALVGPVPAGLPAPVLPDPGQVGPLLPAAAAIAVMSFLESVSAARSSRRADEPAIDPARELTALGAAGVAGAFFRSLPAAGGLSQTAVARAAGARTRAALLVTAALAVSCALLLGGLLAQLPEATLGAVVVTAGIGLVRPAELLRFWRLSRVEFWVAVATAAVAVSLGLLAGALVGVLLTLVLVLWELDHTGVTELRFNVDEDDLRPVPNTTCQGQATSLPPRMPNVLVLRIDGLLYTANVRAVNRRIAAAVDRTPGVTTVIVDAVALSAVPLTVIDQFAELDHDLSARGVAFVLAGLGPVALRSAQRLPRWREMEESGRVQPTALAAVRALRH